jgi:predicted SAM-dependent methyltransferase
MSKYASGERPEVGHIIKCIDPIQNLIREKTYVVRAVELPYVYIMDIKNKAEDGFFAYRFNLVESPDVSAEFGSNPLKLHLGCFHKKIYGFTNVDIRPEVNPDLVDDCALLTKVVDNSVDLIYTSHMMEHFKRDEALKAMRRYYEVLKAKGEIYVSVPDLEMVCRHYILHQDLRLLQNFLYGSQKHVADFHWTGWDFKTLKEDLESVGFSKVERYDTWSTDWGYVDDYSKAYLPHMDFENGVLMSLNVKAIK